MSPSGKNGRPNKVADPLTASLERGKVFQLGSPSKDASAPPPGFLLSAEEQVEQLDASEFEAVAGIEKLESDDLWRRFTELQSELSDFQIWLIAVRFFDLKEEDRAYSVVMELLDTDQNHPAIDYPFIFNQAVHGYLRPTGHAADALAYWRKLIKLYPLEELEREILLDEAVLAVEADLLEQGRNLFDKLQREIPKDPTPHLLHAEALVQIGELAEAESVLAEAESAEYIVWDKERDRLESLLEVIGKSTTFLASPEASEIDQDGAYFGLNAMIKRASRKADTDLSRSEAADLYLYYEKAQERFPHSEEIRNLYRSISQMDERLDLNAVELYLERRLK